MELFDKVDSYKAVIKKNKERLMAILSKVETIITAEDEIRRAISCFDGISVQIPYLSAGKVNSAVSFLPLNQPLYSFILFVVVPSLTADKVYFRPPVLLWEVFDDVFELFSHIITNIIMCNISRRRFIFEYAVNASVVIFTGEYENAIKVQENLRDDTLFLFNGGALNPMIITDSAILDKAVHNVINERLFNSGQDCMAPCAILVDRKISKPFVEMLITNLKREVVGENAAINTTVGQMIKSESVSFVLKLINRYSSNLVYGGKCDVNLRLIEPTLFVFDKITSIPQQLVFAPVFFVGFYDRIEEVQSFLSTDIAQKLRGYISLYADEDFKWTWMTEHANQILLNNSLFNFESANKEFGGYGCGCSFSSFGGNIKIHPLLISKEIFDTFYIGRH